MMWSYSSALVSLLPSIHNSVITFLLQTSWASDSKCRSSALRTLAFYFRIGGELFAIFIPRDIF